MKAWPKLKTYYQNNKFDSPGYTPPSQDNNQIIDTNSSTTSLKSTGNSSSNTGSGFNQQTVQGYATAAQQVAAASQSSSSTGQVLGYTGGVLTATGTAMVAETFGTAQYGYYLILAGTLSSIAGGVASDQGATWENYTMELRTLRIIKIHIQPILGIAQGNLRLC